ncbi:sensor histidine kinase [Thermostaphylospora chromogena]|uniref:histidine kinase n=1 Tax=Thermostaphylospora chromogena TaxID=35622 RepID=A0A1H1B832_9ACTN|nr:histidine kinase [Thermostaphylospora chromogena]SDQ48077.1 Signal transduction histidine kinase [Thermostaphylospora chromogena]
MGDVNWIIHLIRRLSEIALAGTLFLVLLMDVGVTVATIQRTTFVGTELFSALCGIVGLIVVIIRRTRLHPGMEVLLGISLAISIVSILVGTRVMPSFAEGGALMVLTISALRRTVPIGRAVALAVASLIALIMAGLVRMPESFGMVISFIFMTGWMTAAGIGGYLRFQQERRTQAMQAVRRAERLELARELHDLVAHHITGIVVQAQAARAVAEQKPEAVTPALDAIATAGTDALTSMRRLVSVLRASDASRTPGVTLADLRTLVERFSADGPRVAFEIGQGVDDDTLPPEVMTTLHRVLLECLTNIRRHAPATDWVEVDLRRIDGKVWLRVRNRRSHSDSRVSRLGGGFGLVGMAERVEALGGRLWAGPTPDGCWEVRAVF